MLYKRKKKELPKQKEQEDQKPWGWNVPDVLQ